MKLNQLIIALLLIQTGISCTDKRTGTVQEKNETLEAEATLVNIADIAGDYVSEEYLKRDEGYDWIVTSITPISDTDGYIIVRSRADKKKPTCTFDGLGTLQNGSMLVVDVEGHMILFKFTDHTLEVTTEKEEDKDFLMYFCSGGGNFVGTYKKLDEPLEQSQLEPSGYNQSLSLQGITFDIHASAQGSVNLLMITPSGLEADNRPVIHQVEGNVTNAEIEDLNSDGSPEVLVYITSTGSGSYGSVIGYSVNSKKSMSQIYIPPVTDDPGLSKGYMGHDDFAIVETSFARRFPVYREGDANSNPTGGMRQIQYKLVDGENSRILEVVDVYDYPANN